MNIFSVHFLSLQKSVLVTLVSSRLNEAKTPFFGLHYVYGCRANIKERRKGE